MTSLENRAKLACLYAGGVWGLFWIPLRALEDEGLHGLWVTVVYFLVPTLCLLPIGIWRWQYFKVGGVQLQITAMVSGGALLFYSTSIIYTDVVRALLLFYLNPIWATILARIFLGEAISPLRILTIAIAIVGMLTIFGLGVQFPMPRNVGDWMGIAAGILWAVAMVRLRLEKDTSAIDITIGFFFWSFIFSFLVAIVLASSYVPSVSQTLPAMPLLLIFMVLLILPGTYASLWGPKFLSPGIVALLFMTEIIVGSISVALLTAEPFGVREVTGILLITSASLLEPIISLVQRSNKSV